MHLNVVHFFHNHHSGSSNLLQVNLRDTFGNAAVFLGDAKINIYSPDLRHVPVAQSDAGLVFELTSEKAVRAAQVWVQLLNPSGLHATVYSYYSQKPQAQFSAPSLDLPCSNCSFVAAPGQSYTYRFEFPASLWICIYILIHFVRWAGFLFSTQASTLTFAFHACHMNPESSITLYVHDLSSPSLTSTHSLPGK